MTKKEEYFCLFSSCLQSTGQQKQAIIASPDELKWRSTKNESKISLKQTKQSSIQSQIKSRDQRSVLRNKSSKIDQIYQSSKENRLISTNRTYNSPCQKKIAEKMPLNGISMKSAPKHQYTRQLSLINSNGPRQKGFEEMQLQKTTKFFPPNSKESLRSSHLKHLELQQTKILKKSNFITNLDSYKQSIVSINNQNESIHQKLEESMIMIDFFNPTQEKVMAFQKLLINRQ